MQFESDLPDELEQQTEKESAIQNDVIKKILSFANQDVESKNDEMKPPAKEIKDKNGDVKPQVEENKVKNGEVKPQVKENKGKNGEMKPPVKEITVKNGETKTPVKRMNENKNGVAFVDLDV